MLGTRVDIKPTSIDTIALPSDVDPSGGVAMVGTKYFAFDVLTAKVHAVRLDGTELWSAGREGDGPGEFARSATLMRTGRSQWVAPAGVELFVFDGRSLHRFSETGSQFGSWNVGRSFVGMLGSSSRIRIHDGSVVLDAARAFSLGADGKAKLSSREFVLYRAREDSIEQLISIALPELPRSTQGTIVDGLSQAKPSWDLSAGCAVITDGHSASLIFGDLTRNVWDTLAYAIPNEFRDPQEANATTSGVLRSGNKAPMPTAAARIADVAFYPGGFLWLRPAKRLRTSNGEQVWQIRLSDGAVEKVSVSAFPTASAAGSMYGIATDSLGHHMLIRASVIR